MQKKIKFTLKILFPILVTSSTNYYSKEGVKKKKNDKPIISSCYYITPI